MNKRLPSRPNLDHLRRQAKSLLAALQTGDADAVKTFQEHLPAAKDLSAAKVRAAGYRLADAQSALARKSGFAAWPQLARHVEQLRALEGSWTFAHLEVDGAEVPPAAMTSSRLLIDGDRFRMESPEATYEGIFNIDVEADPHHIDIEFVEGPEAGNTNHGIFRIADGGGDQLDICLDMSGKSRPAAFRTTPGSGHAFETLRRASAARPHNVSGGNPTAPPYSATGPCVPPAGASPPDQPAPASPEDFPYVESPTLTRLQGEWTAEKLVRDGQEIPPSMCQTGRRSAARNEIKIQFGGQLIIHALVRINEAARPMQVDYFNLAAAAKGSIQRGIMEWRDEIACFCMALPGAPRPTDFDCPPGSGRTLSQWRRK